MSREKKEESTKSVIINSVDRSIDVLEYLFSQGRDISISQISKDLGIYKSTVFRTLATLENRGYVMQNKITEQYSVGPKLYAYSTISHDAVIIESAKPFIQEVNDKYGEHVTLGSIGKDKDGNYVNVLLYAIESTHNLGMSLKLSNQTECYCASLGKCMLAFSEDVNLDVYKNGNFIKFTNNTITTYSGLLAELERVRAAGYAIDAEEREIGLYCLGVPIFNSRGYAVAALSISGPKSRIKDESFDEKVQFMKEICSKISKTVFI